MGVCTHTMADHTSAVAPARLFHAYAIDNANFFPKALPTYVKSIDVVEGEIGSAGNVLLLHFAEGKHFNYAKNRVDEVDATNFYWKYTTIEGDVLRDVMEYSVYETKFEASGDGSRYTMVAHYHTKGDYVVTEEEIARGKESIKKMFNTAEEYLTANPQLYA